jgi:hypothetical protein
VRHIARLEKEIEELKQERDRAFDKASDRDRIAAQLRALRIALYELRDDRERWRCLAERLSALSAASRRRWWPWSRTGTSPPAAADRSASARGAAIRARLLSEDWDGVLTVASGDSLASLPDQAGSPRDENAPDIHAAGLEQALERLAREAEQRRNGHYERRASSLVASPEPSNKTPRGMAT